MFRETNEWHIIMIHHGSAPVIDPKKSWKTQHRPMAKGQKSRSSPMATSWYSTVIETPSS